MTAPWAQSERTVNLPALKTTDRAAPRAQFERTVNLPALRSQSVEPHGPSLNAQSISLRVR
jgi:hypothetical protein